MINKFLLARDKFMLEMHLRQPGFTYSVCGPFTKNKERIKKKLKELNIQDLWTYSPMTKFKFRTVKLTKNADPDIYRYSEYGTGFDTRGSFSFSDGSNLVEM